MTTSICGAATKAVLLWILFYVVLLHGFVAWKWDSVSITIDQHPSVWDNNNNIMNSGMKSGNGVVDDIAAKQVANKEKQLKRLERRAARKEQLRTQQQAARQQERAAKKHQARNERKLAFLQQARSVRAEERVKRLQEKRSAAIAAALQERQVQRAIRKEQALQRIAENKTARKAAYEQALATKAARKKARQLERLETARIALLAERAAAKEAARAAAAHKRANSTIQQVQEEEQLRAAIHVQEAFIDKQESYIRVLSHRLHRVSEARTRIRVQQDDNNPEEESWQWRRRLDLEQALQQKINQVVMAITHPDDILSLSLLSTPGSAAGYSAAPHQLDPLVVWLQKQVQVLEEVVEESSDNEEEEEMTTVRTISKNSSDLLLLHPTLDDLLQQFEYMDSVLQHQINQAATVNWTQIHELLRNEYPSKESSSSSSSTALYCSNAHEAAVMAKMEQQESSTAHGQRRQELILSASNLAQRLEAAVNMHNYTTLDQLVDHHHVPIYFSETYDNIYTKLNEAMEAWLQRVTVAFHEYEEEANVLVGKKDASSTSSTVSAEVDESGGGDGGGCVSMDQVHELLRDGLDALNRNQDLRQALLYSMSRLDMNASSIILDAMLPVDDNDMQKLRDGYDDDDDESETTTSVTRRSLRELLDRPVTQEVANWVNLVLDTISGHFDGMDRFLDETIPAGVDVGDYVVNRLLELAGTFGDRTVMARIGRILPKKIRQSF